MTLTAILTQDKSDRAVIKQALTEGYNGVQICKALTEIYPKDYPTSKDAHNFYHEVTAYIPDEFFLNLQTVQNEKI